MNLSSEPAPGIPAAVIRTEGLTRRYVMGNSTVNALNGVNFLVMPGEFVALMGSSGSGKSTLLHVIGCLERPSSGDYWLEGQNVSSLKKDALAEVRGRWIGFIFQNFNLLPRYSAWENVALPLAYCNGKVKGAVQRARAMEAIKRVGLERRASHHPTEMSGGERQRLAIARALVTRPAVILADEPTGNLDSRTGSEIMALLSELHREGATILMVTHDSSIAMHASRICTMRDGLLSEGDSPHVSR